MKKSFLKVLSMETLKPRLAWPKKSSPEEQIFRLGIWVQNRLHELLVNSKMGGTYRQLDSRLELIKEEACTSLTVICL